jgi:hypothetical protein
VVGLDTDTLWKWNNGIPAGQNKDREELKTNHEELMAVMKAGHEKLMAVMKAEHEELMAGCLFLLCCV